MAVKERAIRGVVCSKTKHPQDSQDDNISLNRHYKDLQDVRWRKKRLAVIARANFKCQHCGVTDCAFDVHHLYYIKGKRLWQYPYKALLALCRQCHTKWHEQYRLEYRERVWGYNEPYEAPKHNKVYFVTKGKKSVRVEYPDYYHIKKRPNKTVKLTKRDELKAVVKRKVKKGKLVFNFAPIPEWRKKQKEQGLV